MKSKNFKVGNIIKHSVTRSNDVYFTDAYGEKRFSNKEVVSQEETLLIVGYENGCFIVYPMETNVDRPKYRTYVTYGGFHNCFKMLAKYVNDSCTPVST